MPKNNKKITKFIAKLVQILQDHSYKQIIRWTEDGTGVQIRNRKQLQQKVLHQHFKLKKVASFIRQLHLYGFHKSKTSGKGNSFQHPLFINDEKADYSVIKRKPKQNKQKSQLPQKKQQQSIAQDNDKLTKQSQQSQQTLLPQLCSIKSFTIIPKNHQSINRSMENIFEQWYFNNEEEYSFDLDICMD